MERGQVAIEEQYLSDYRAILSHRYDNGADYWTTPDKRFIKGSPFSTMECIRYLLELGMNPKDPLLLECTDLIFSTWRSDGSFKLYPQGNVYPCHTVNAVDVLCQMGYETDERIQKTYQHLLDTQCQDGGWRCNKYSFGRGPETLYSNPFPTLMALSAFRYSSYRNREPALDRAVEFLLAHWTIRKPIGPCHYGIGSLFMQIEYPFRSYNLFIYVYILSFFAYAKEDSRFKEALNVLESKLINGKIVVERIVPKLAKFSFCKKGEPSELATARYQEILKNIGRNTE